MVAPLMPFRPNWRRPVLERLEWLTEVIEARDGSETVTPLRRHPRRTLEFETLLQTSALQRFDALLWAHGGGPYALPIWPDVQRLAAALPSGADEIPCATAGMDYVDGGLAVLWADDARNELVQVASVAADALVLDGVTQSTWPAGTRLLPAREARLPAEVSAPRVTSALAQAVLQFEISGAPAVPAYEPALEYDEIEVHTRRPDWSAGVPMNYRRSEERVDFGPGPVFVDTHSTEYAVRTHTYKLLSRADIDDYRRWLHARRGRGVPFWQPQWQHDLSLTAPVAAADTSIVVRSSAASIARPGRQHVALRNLRTGQWACRQVLDIDTIGPLQVLTLDAAVGFDAPAAGVMATWLALSRLDADAIEIAWHSAGRAVSVCDVRSLR